MSAEDRETLSLGLAHGHSLRTMASVLGRAPQHREPRVGPQRGERPLLSGLYGTDSGGGPRPVGIDAATVRRRLKQAVESNV